MSKSAQSDVTSEINKKADKEIEKQFGDYYKKENLGQYRTKIVPQMRRQFFRQNVQNERS